MLKTKTTVLIDGIEYKLSGSESEEYMHQVAILVDSRLRKTKTQCESLNTTLVAVLTAVNIADELIKERWKNQALENQMRDQFANKPQSNNSKSNTFKPFNINL